MKIIPQCDDYSGSDGVIQEYTTLLLCLEYETNYSVLTKAHHKKQYFHIKHRRKPFSPLRQLKKANLRSEYLPTISKTVFSIPPGDWNIFRIMKVPFQIQLQCVINANILIVYASENLILAYLQLKFISKEDVKMARSPARSCIQLFPCQVKH